VGLRGRTAPPPLCHLGPYQLVGGIAYRRFGVKQ
jgi:hypothetical protein